MRCGNNNPGSPWQRWVRGAFRKQLIMARREARMAAVQNQRLGDAILTGFWGSVLGQKRYTAHVLPEKEEVPMRTGDKCERTGVYQPFCCPHDCLIHEGETFPPCPKCGNPTSWSMVRLAPSLVAGTDAH